MGASIRDETGASVTLPLKEALMVGAGDKIADFPVETIIRKRFLKTMHANLSCLGGETGKKVNWCRLMNDNRDNRYRILEMPTRKERSGNVSLFNSEGWSVH